MEDLFALSPVPTHKCQSLAVFPPRPGRRAKSIPTPSNIKEFERDTK